MKKEKKLQIRNCTLPLKYQPVCTRSAIYTTEQYARLVSSRVDLNDCKIEDGNDKCKTQPE